MTSFLILSAIALAPGAYLAKAMYLKDKYEPEPKRLLLGAFIAGGLALILPAICEAIVHRALGLGRIGDLGMAGAFILAFIVVGPVEELAKFWVLRYYAYPKKDFNEPFDGIVYGSFVALGFATLENLAYVFEGGIGTGVVRMFTAVPGHYAFGVIMGYYVGKAKFDPTRRGEYFLRGLIYASLLHGAYDFFVIQGVFPALRLLTPVALLLALAIARKAIRELQADSRWRFSPSPILQPPPIPLPLMNPIVEEPPPAPGRVEPPT